VSRKQVLIGVEGNHDQAFLSRILRKILKFRDFKEDQKEKVVIPNSIEFRADVTIDEIPPNPP
jgi:D-Tyr-tRNAtyr deacylase